MQHFVPLMCKNSLKWIFLKDPLFFYYLEKSILQHFCCVTPAVEAHPPRLWPLFPPPLSFLGSTTLRRSTHPTQTHLIRCVHTGPNLPQEPEEPQDQWDRESQSVSQASPSLNLHKLLVSLVVGVSSRRAGAVWVRPPASLSGTPRRSGELIPAHGAPLWLCATETARSVAPAFSPQHSAIAVQSSARLPRTTTACLVCTSTEERGGKVRRAWPVVWHLSPRRSGVCLCVCVRERACVWVCVPVATNMLLRAAN